MNDTEILDFAVNKVVQSQKYANISLDFVRWIVLNEKNKFKKIDAIIQSSRSRLHQSTTSYLLHKPHYSQLIQQLDDLPSDITDVHIRNWCQACMQLHSSSNERLPVLDQFFNKIFNLLPKVQSILDIACGVNPLAMPWMPISRFVEYTAIDIFTDQSSLINAFFEHCQLKAKAYVRNIMDKFTPNSADVAFLFKILPIIEQLEKNSSINFLNRIDAPYLVISFPVSSLGGKDKGMRVNYANQFLKLTSQTKWLYKRLDFTSELVFVVKR